MEKKVSLRNTQITFSIWDLGGQKEFISMLPLVCNESAVMLFLFDLGRPSTLASVKEWYRQVRTHNKTAIPFLVGTHFDVFAQQPPDAQVHALCSLFCWCIMHCRLKPSRPLENMQQP
jgi:GTP-binding protein of the ras superfamily involved in termination of M-phase